MPHTLDLPVAAAYVTLGHVLTMVDPVSVVQLPDGGDCVTYNFEEHGQDARFTRQAILEAVNSVPDAASRFDDLIERDFPQLADAWRAALAAAAARGATHARSLLELAALAPVLIATRQADGSILFVNQDATPEQVRQLARL